MAKYDRLRKHLINQQGATWSANFLEIEAILESTLPPSARTYAEWWANTLTGGPQAASWINAGWRAEDLNLRGEQVTFRRTSAPVLNTASSSRSDVQESPVHLWDLAETTACQIEMRWAPIGRIVLDQKGRLAFPVGPQQPGLYRFRIRRDIAEAVYFGETDNLSRRFGNYRNPGLTQLTNVRLNTKFREVLSAGGEIAVAVIVADAWIEREGVRQNADLSSKAMRCFFENAAIVLGRGADIESLNRAEVARTERVDS